MRSLKIIQMEKLSPIEISKLPWPKGCYYGLASLQTRTLLHASDSLAWIKGQFRRAIATHEGPNETLAKNYQIIFQ